MSRSGFDSGAMTLVGKMARSSAVSSLGSQFDDFLFTPIGAEKSGTLLSVLSALARLDLDPWQEAAKLAGLPQEAATQRLASLIAALPAGLSPYPDHATNAARLIALLPRRASSNNIRLLETVRGANGVGNVRTFIVIAIMAFVLGAQCIMASRQPPRQADATRVPAASSSALLHTPFPGSGQ